jgi:hypothetical protein
MKLHVCAILFLLSACAHRPSNEVFLNEEMLPDGTWEIVARVSCEDFESPKCREKIQKLITAHATNLCAAVPAQVFNCADRKGPDGTAYGTCYARCK